MNVTNQDEIKHCFALLIDRLRNALKVGGVEASDISQYLKDMKLTLQCQLSNLETILTIYNQHSSGATTTLVL